MNILFICPYATGTTPSQRFRFEQYFSYLRNENIHSEVRPFFSAVTGQKFNQPGPFIFKLTYLLSSLLKRCYLLFSLKRFDIVFIHREAVPFGPPIIEWVIARIWKKKIVYDFDDAIWLTDRTNEPWTVKRMKWRSKVGAICKLSYKISCGNPYLAEFAKSFNANVYVMPTTIDIENAHKPRNRSVRSDGGTTIGWTGSHSTLKYLSAVVPVLQALEEKFPQIDFLIIADKNPGLPLKRVTFKPWSKETEIEDLAEIDIGIMPLPDDPWTRGKCGFKALQYMAMSIPAVLSPVGINRDIIEDGREGYWCTTPEDWSTRLEELVMNDELRKRMGIKGREKITAHYSVASNLVRFLSLFQ